MRGKLTIGIASVALVGLIAAARWTAAQLSLPKQSIPTARVKRGKLDLNVYTTGELRPGRSAMLVAPPVGGATLRIVHLAKTGTPVKSGDLVIEFDPSEQEYNLEQNRSELLQADQEITKAKADAAVQAAQDEVALLKAKYDVRQAELDVSKNELVSAIDAKKNLLKLEEAKRALAQLEQDVKSHSASNQATLAVNEEKRNKARLAMEQAQQNITNMRVRSPFDGVVEVKENRDAAGGFSWGQPLPEYREGDEVQPGTFVAQASDTAHMELRAQVNEADRANLTPGQAVETAVDAVPGETFRGQVKTLAGSAAASDRWWMREPIRKFDISFQLDRFDARLRPGFTANLTIAGRQLKNALYLPRQAIFEKAGKPIVYVKSGSRFVPRDVKVNYQTESHVAIEGLNEGTAVALVNPEGTTKQPQTNAGPVPLATAGGR